MIQYLRYIAEEVEKFKNADAITAYVHSVINMFLDLEKK